MTYCTVSSRCAVSITAANTVPMTAPPKIRPSPIFSRFRRMEIGQTHKFALRYLANYPDEAAYAKTLVA